MAPGSIRVRQKKVLASIIVTSFACLCCCRTLQQKSRTEGESVDWDGDAADVVLGRDREGMRQPTNQPPSRTTTTTKGMSPKSNISTPSVERPLYPAHAPPGRLQPCCRPNAPATSPPHAAALLAARHVRNPAACSAHLAPRVEKHTHYLNCSPYEPAKPESC